MLYNLTEQPLDVKQYKLRRAAKTIGCMFKQIGITPCQGYIRCYVTNDKKLSCGQVAGPKYLKNIKMIYLNMAHSLIHKFQLCKFIQLFIMVKHGKARG